MKACFFCNKNNYMGVTCKWCKEPTCLKCIQPEIHKCYKLDECIKQKTKELHDKLYSEQVKEVKQV